MDKYKCVAPHIDRLLRYFRESYLNPSCPSPKLAAAMDPLFAALSELAPLKRNEEAKSIWLRIPRGGIEYYDSFEDMKESGEVETREEYEARWQEEYPDEIKWYELVIAESRDRNGNLRFRAVSLDHKMVISASLDREDEPSNQFTEEAAITLCDLLTDAVAEPLRKLKDGTYNVEVNAELPYQFRTGVIRRSALWAVDTRWKAQDMDGLSDESAAAFRRLLASGANDPLKTGRIKSFTANDFFRASAIGYKALGYDCEGKSLSEIYRRYADGRDEGLTGKGYGLNEGPGIDFDSPEAWEAWYSGRNRGGHPWEIIRGGNSTHVDLFVRHDRQELDWQLRFGKISEQEYARRMAAAGYYFLVCGKHRPLEAVTFYITLSAAGLPVILDDADELLARIDGTDYVGIVPRYMPTRYCEELFPDCYGHVIDFIHIYDEDMEQFGTAIEWLPEEEARLIDEHLE